MTESATGLSMTWVHFSSGTGSRFWLRSRTSRMLRGSQCTPWAAKVAYAFAIAKGVTSATPRVSVGTRGSSSPLPV